MSAEEVLAMMQLFSDSGASTVLGVGRPLSIHAKTGSEQETSSWGTSPDSSAVSICATDEGVAANNPHKTKSGAKSRPATRSIRDSLSFRRVPRYVRPSHSTQ